jgi:hypothetical protein
MLSDHFTLFSATSHIQQNHQSAHISRGHVTWLRRHMGVADMSVGVANMSVGLAVMSVGVAVTDCGHI